MFQTLQHLAIEVFLLFMKWTVKSQVGQELTITVNIDLMNEDGETIGGEAIERSIKKEQSE